MTEAVTDQSVAEFLAEQWDPQLTLRQWWARLGASGLAFPTWRRRWHGRDWPRRELGACSQAFAAAGAIGAPTGLGTLMGGPVVLHSDADQPKHRGLTYFIIDMQQPGVENTAHQTDECQVAFQ